jgi:hypothetical protein
LPERYAEALVAEIGDHLRGVLEALGGKAVVAFPVVLEPPGVEVDDVGGEAELAELGGDFAGLGLGLVGDAAHPEPEAPERRHGRAAGEGGVGADDLLWLAEEEEEIEGVLAGGEDGARGVGRAEVHRDGRRGVEEHAVAAAAEEKRHRLVGRGAFRAEGVGGGKDEALPAFVEGGEGFATAEDVFAGREGECGGEAARGVGGAAHEAEAGDVAVEFGGGEQAAGGIAQLHAPGFFTDENGAARAGVAPAAVDLFAAPRAGVARFADEHERGCAGRGRVVGAAQAKAQRARVDEAEFERKLGIGGVDGFRPLVGADAFVVGGAVVEGQAAAKAVAFPDEGALAGGEIEGGEVRGEKVEIRRIAEVGA